LALHGSGEAFNLRTDMVLKQAVAVLSKNHAANRTSMSEADAGATLLSTEESAQPQT
jgi:hypothetical protein